MNKEIMILDDKQTLLKRLIQLDNNSYLAERFYPLLVVNAGTEISPEGIVMLIVLAIEDYIKNQSMPPQIRALLNMNINRYIDIIAGDREDIAEKAKAFYQEASNG